MDYHEMVRKRPEEVKELLGITPEERFARWKRTDDVKAGVPPSQRPLALLGKYRAGYYCCCRKCGGVFSMEASTNGNPHELELELDRHCEYLKGKVIHHCGGEVLLIRDAGERSYQLVGVRGQKERAPQST